MERFFPALCVGALLLAGVATAQPNYDVSAVLARARDRVLELTERLPRYTCIETVNRTYLGSGRRPGPSCDQLAGEAVRGRRKLTLEATDRLRLDIIVTDGHEVYSWAGASHFDSRYVGEIVGDGPIGTGPFGTFLIDIFRNDGARFEFQDNAQLHGKTVLEYAYQVPLEASHYFTENMDRSWRATAFSGSIWIDPGPAELKRLTVRTSELPPETGACTADTQVDYQTVRLGTGAFLLPLESELHFVLRDGTESSSTAAYAKCREYLAESNLSFVEPAEAAPVTEAAPAATPIPDGLKVDLALVAPIDTGIAAAGDVVAAKVKNAVRNPKANAVVIPAGATVHGRIVRMERRLLPSPHFLISLSWNDVEMQKTVTPFFARIEQIDYQQYKEQAQFRTRVTVWLPPPGESRRAGGWFILPTAHDRYVVPAGYTTQWMTARPPQRNIVNP